MLMLGTLSYHPLSLQLVIIVIRKIMELHNEMDK
jgi:hypothetical protein